MPEDFKCTRKVVTKKQKEEGNLQTTLVEQEPAANFFIDWNIRTNKGRPCKIEKTQRRKIEKQIFDKLLVRDGRMCATSENILMTPGADNITKATPRVAPQHQHQPLQPSVTEPLQLQSSVAAAAALHQPFSQLFKMSIAFLLTHETKQVGDKVLCQV